MQDNVIARAADLLRQALSVTVLTGAGVSKESGIPTYRDTLTGLWANYDFAELASPEGFQRNPKLVWDWYVERRVQLQAVQPNAGHSALAQIARRYSNFTLITQNVDDLHERGGSRGVLHLHGNLMRTKCFFDCQGHPTIVAEADFVTQDEDAPPACPHCGCWLRPDVVWFGEMLPYGMIEMAKHAVVTSDLVFVIGTSGMVYPAAALPYAARRADVPVIEINPEETDLSELATIPLRGTSGVILPQLLEAL
jgi:NAD-dependent deacetylase